MAMLTNFMAMQQMANNQYNNIAMLGAEGYAQGAVMQPFGADNFNRVDLSGEFGGGAGMPSFMAGQQFGVLGGQGGVGMFNQGGFGGGFGNNMNPQMMMQMMMMMMRMMMQMMQQMQGGRGQCGQSPFQNPNGGFGRPLNMPGMPGMGGPGGPGMGGPQQVVSLQKGGTWQAPDGTTVSWQGDKVQVHDAGGSGRSVGGGQPGGGGFGSPFSQGAMAFAGSFAGPNGAGAFAGAFAGAGNPCCCCCQPAAQQGCGQQPQDWNVFGDPHIKNPDGSKQDFNRNNGMFTLGDGTRVLIVADGPNKETSAVVIYPSGNPVGPTNVNGKNVDFNNTTNYGMAQDGKFHDLGSVAQTMGTSPFGNNLFGGFGNMGNFGMPMFA